MKRLIALCFAFTLAACSQPMEPEFDRSNQVMSVKVVVHDNTNDLSEARRQRLGVDALPSREGTLQGWAGWSKEAPYQCEIHVLRASSQQDYQFSTWGHELAHCLYGNYHPE